MPSKPGSDVFTLGDLSPKVIVDIYRVILVMMLVRIPTTKSEKW